MLEDIKSIKKTNDHTILILKKMMNSGEFTNPNSAFVVLRATLKALRDRVTPGEAFHLGGQLPALLRGYFFEGFDLSNVERSKSSSKSIEGFLQDIRNHLGGYDYLDLEKLVPVAMNVILTSIDQGEAEQVISQLPKDIQSLRGV